MSPQPVYLDANASEMLRPEARDAAVAALAIDGNPASIHRAGRRARSVLEDARERIAFRFGADPAGLVFTSGGTESNALAIAALGAGRRVLIGATEHDAVRAAAPGATALPVRADGTLDPAVLDAALAASGQPALVCLMRANNETGVLHPLDQLEPVCRRHGARLHVDAVQAAGRIPLALDGAHSMALSGHKIGGPKGAGALLLRRDAAGEGTGFGLPPSLAGGGQERGRRGGTPSLPAIAGFAAACVAACDALERYARLGQLRDRIEQAAVEAGAIVAGAAAQRLHNTSCLVLPGRRADAQLIALDLAGFSVSAGAACSSGKVARSHVLAAMGLGTTGQGATGQGATGRGAMDRGAMDQGAIRPADAAGEAIRVSLPWCATAEDAERFIAAYRRMASGARIPAPARISA